MTAARRRVSRLVFAVIAVATCGMAHTVAAFTPRPAPGRLLLKVRDQVAVTPVASKSGGAPATGRPSLDAIGARFDVRVFTAQFPAETGASKALAGFDLSKYFVLEFPADVDLDAIRAAYASDPAIELAEFDMMHPLALEVNDSSAQWYIESSTGHDAHLTGGWNHSIGDSSVVLGIADSGVDWQHPDLGGSAPNHTNGNIWTNWPEKNGTPGVDDDANGFVDDIRGWDFVSSLTGAWPGEDATLADNDPSDFNGHGTHVSGIASARTNNGEGAAGVGYRCKIMALRIGGSIDDQGNEQGVVLMSAAATAVNYARVKGAVVFNCSWGSSNTAALSAAVSSAVAAGMVITVAAGNDNNEGASYLSGRGDCFDVAATDQNDVKASFSSYGTWVDVSAPGVAIYNTYFDHTLVGAARHTYTQLQGTSMAAPLVCGLVGLVKAHNPTLNGTAIKLLIKQGCDNIEALNPAQAGKLGSGRVNALRTFKDYFLSVPVDYSTFSKALSASGAGDTLAFQGGVVHASTWYVNRSQRLIQGGWNAGFTARNPTGNPTLVQPLTGPGVWFPSGTGVDSTLVLDGIKVIGGQGASQTSPIAGFLGGGVLCTDTSPTIQNCTFESSVAGDATNFGAGGGGFFANSTARIVNCAFRNNAAQRGGGLALYQSSVRLENCIIEGNSLFDASMLVRGAGIHVEGGSPIATSLVCEDNIGADEGGGLYLASGTPRFVNSAFSNNAATSQGGNFHVAAGTLTLDATAVRGGSAQFGAGIATVAGATLDLESCVFAGNVAQFIGGGIYSTGAAATLRNVTFDGNRGTLAAGDAIYAGSCPSPWALRNGLITNHVSAGNTACVFSGMAPALDWNFFFGNAGGNVSGGALGPNDAITNPLYVNASMGDVALGLHSPAIDSGDPALLDPDGSRSDRGAYGGPVAASRAPVRPIGLAAQRLMDPTRNQLTWTANTEPDLASYAVYRDASSSFVPSASSYIGSSATASFTDNAGGPADYYRIAALDMSGASSGWSVAVQPTGSTDVPPIPVRFALHAPVPNPFNPTTALQFDLPVAALVVLDVYDAHGRHVRRLAQGTRDAGQHRVFWDGRDDAGMQVGSGTYLARIVAGRSTAAHKLTLVR